MKQYHDLLRRILSEGTRKDDRTGTGTISVFGHQMRFDLADGFPLVTTKKMFLRGVIHELLWFLRGDTNIQYLLDHDVHIWDEWADENLSIGPGYGKQWRSWDRRDGSTIDQIAQVVEQIRSNPDSRRLIVSAWNVAEIDEMALPPCHLLFQFYSQVMSTADRVSWAARHLPKSVSEEAVQCADDGELDVVLRKNSVPERRLSCQLYQRSADTFLGVPFNIASYALLTHMIAQVTGHAPGDFVHTLGDAHIYQNHLGQVKLQLTREPLPLPRLSLNPAVKSVFGFGLDDIEVIGYEHHPAIRGEVSV